jgi:hypothetical protein
MNPAQMRKRKDSNIIFFFFDKLEEYIKKRRGAQPLVHRGYTKGS